MGRAIRRFLFALVIFAPAHLFGQEVFSPLIVEGPQISRTAFFNWEKIELTYTVRWMDGYEPVLNDLRPQAMSFGILELDPDMAEVSDIRNEREFGNENFFDIVYHLRYMGEKKGELIIPGQKFNYKRVQSGDDQVQSFSTPEFTLSYYPVIPKNADDIKEEWDPGSYQELAMYWKLSAAAIFLFGILGSFVLVFFRPVPVALAEKKEALAVAKATERILEPASVLHRLRDNIFKGNIGAVCNGLGDLIRAYVPAVGPGMTSKDMVGPITDIPHVWERVRLLRIHQELCGIEDFLFGGEDAVYSLKNLYATLQELSPVSVYWRRRLFILKQKLAKPFLPLIKLIQMRRS